MTPAYLVFLTFMTLAMLLMIAGYIRLLFFVKRWELLAGAGLNPIKGVILWKRMFTRNGFGEEPEPGRRSVARLYYSAVLAFVVAVTLFFVLPSMPR
jgi:hypothetical protein